MPDGARYAPAGLRRLSPRLKGLRDLGYTREEQLAEARRLATKLSIQGVQPKLSTRLDPPSESFVLVERGGTFILKLQNPLYPELPENEDVTMCLAGSVGIEVPLHGLLFSKDESLTYFIKRYDRVGSRGKLSVEDFAQLSGNTRETKYDFSMERIPELLDRFAAFPALEKAKLFERTLFSFLVGNEDMHLKNFSMLERDGVHALSPAYDLVNTTIALPSPVEELALPLNGKKRRLTRFDLVDSFGRERLGLTRGVIDDTLARFRAAVPGWSDLVARSFLSEARKEAYRELLRERLARLALAA